MNFLQGLVTNIKDMNTATLTGAVDVILVQQRDGTFKSTPFHVRFGKIGVAWSHNKMVYVEVNGKEVDLTMRLDQWGTAYFPDTRVSENTSNEEISGRDRRRSRHHSNPDIKSPECDNRADSRVTQLLQESIQFSAAKATSNPHLEDIVDLVKINRNTLDLSGEQLSEYNLKPGSNEIVFSVTTQYQGTTKCSCSVFVWSQTDRIVISDIDGTITKSDVRGMILPLIGVADWAQGEVTSLFSKIHSNGYKVLYLSARSISQAAETKSYLKSLSQGNLQLPPGPLFLNPESALKSFKREVIDKQPQIFKINCLSVLQRLFLHNPFFAGYGNKPTDVTAYEQVGIPSSHIFIINKSGKLKHQVSETIKTSYKDQCNMVDYFFPPVSKALVSSDNFQYWSEPMPEVDLNKI